MSKNIAVIFAGGTGIRMNSVSRPKQFIEFNGKPIIIHTLEIFENHPQIDSIIVVCLESWIDFLNQQLEYFHIKKVVSVVPGGPTGQESIYNGLVRTHELFGDDVVVLIHDGVRPLITAQTITDNIETVAKYGNCITCIPAVEPFVVQHADGSLDIPPRKDSLITRAPQSFILRDILTAHKKAIAENKMDFVDSCMMMDYYGHKLHTIIGPFENIKITTPTDFFLFRAFVSVRENQQLFGF